MSTTLKKLLAMINEELERSDQLGTLQEAAEVRRLKGEAILRCGSSAIGEAVSTFRETIEIARPIREVVGIARDCEPGAFVGLNGLLRRGPCNARATTTGSPRVSILPI